MAPNLSYGLGSFADDSLRFSRIANTCSDRLKEVSTALYQLACHTMQYNRWHRDRQPWMCGAMERSYFSRVTTGHISIQASC